MGENINENDVYSFIDIGVVLHSNVKQEKNNKTHSTGYVLIKT